MRLKESAGHLLRQLGKALAKPGVDRKVILHSTIGEKAFIYSIDPEDPKYIIREDRDGRKVRGTLVRGRFKITK